MTAQNTIWNIDPIAVPLNTRLSEKEIDHVLVDATPHGLIRHSSLAAPTVQLPWQQVLDAEPLDLTTESHPDKIGRAHV